MKIFETIIENIIKFVIGFSSLVLAVVTLLQVISRFILKSPIAWGQDIVRLCFVYLIFWGGAYCVKEKEHLNIDILLTSLKIRTREKMELIISIVLSLFFIFIIYYGYIFTQSGASQKAPYLNIPMSIYYLSLPTAGILMLFYQIKVIIMQIKKLKNNEDMEGDQI